MVPTLTLSKVEPNDWSSSEMPGVFINWFDNTNVLVWRLGPEDKEKAQYIAVTDYPLVNEIDIDTLAVKRQHKLDPIVEGMSTASCAHWRREHKKNTSINYHIMVNPLNLKNYFKLYRFG